MRIGTCSAAEEKCVDTGPTIAPQLAYRVKLGLGLVPSLLSGPSLSCPASVEWEYRAVVTPALRAAPLG